jgi:hypothetical protein
MKDWTVFKVESFLKDGIYSWQTDRSTLSADYIKVKWVSWLKLYVTIYK